MSSSVLFVSSIFNMDSSFPSENKKNPLRYQTFMYIKHSDAFHYVLLDRIIPPRGVVTLEIQSDACDGGSNEINTLEHVQVRLQL